MKKTILVCTLLIGVLSQSAFGVPQEPVPEVGSTLGLFGLAMATIGAISWKRKK